MLVKRSDWLNAAELTTLLATILFSSFQQAFLYTLLLYLGLHRAKQYRQEQQFSLRIEQHFQHTIQTTNSWIAQVKADYTDLANQLPDRNDIRSLEGRVGALETTHWQEQVTNLQDWVSDLDASNETLHDRTRNLEQFIAQLVALQQKVEETQSQSLRGRVAIFIDGNNLFNAAQKLGIKIDYANLLAVLTASSPLFRAFFYIKADSASLKQQSFLVRLRNYGYHVVSKKAIVRRDGSIKANLDVEIALDMISLVEAYDTAVLVSDNEELACAIKAISSRGTRVEVVSLQSNKLDSLTEVADAYIDLETIKDEICK